MPMLRGNREDRVTAIRLQTGSSRRDTMSTAPALRQSIYSQMSCEHGYARTVDHRKTCETLNNQKCNLRFATLNEQMRNQRIPCDNTSGVKGVGWEEDRKRFRAVITVNYKQIFLGRRKTIEEAAALYRAAQIKYHGEFANFD
jgi:hypothetical protein